MGVVTQSIGINQNPGTLVIPQVPFFGSIYSPKMVPWMLTHSLLREGPQQEHSHQFKGLQSGIQAKKRESAQKQAPVEAEPKTVEIGPTFDGPTPIL